MCNFPPLDRCATVDEALSLLETVDVRHDLKAGSGYHYMVADANGDCAVIEFDLYNGWKAQFSNVYDQSSLTLSLRNWNDYAVTHTFTLQ